MILLTAVPIIIFAIGVFCEKIDKRLLFCTTAAVGIFMICGFVSLGGFVGADSLKLPIISRVIGAVPFETLGMMDAPPAYVLIIKICAARGADGSAAAFVVAVIQTLFAFYALYTQSSSPFAAAAVLTFCFLPVSFAGASVFTAALICLSASVYIRERRFFRYAAMILLAACFDMSALMMIPLYFIMIIPNVGISAVVSVLITVLLYLFPEARDYIFDFFGGGTFTSAQVPVALAVIVCIAALICLLMYAMFRNREGSYETLIPVMFCGACMSVLSIFDVGFFGITLILLMQSMVPLAPEFKEIGRQFLGIVFPNYKMTSRLIFDAVCVLSLVGVCLYLVYGNVFGTEAYEAALKAGLGL